jgi:hypothetical protein
MSSLTTATMTRGCLPAPMRVLGTHIESLGTGRQVNHGNGKVGAGLTIKNLACQKNKKIIQP